MPQHHVFTTGGQREQWERGSVSTYIGSGSTSKVSRGQTGRGAAVTTITPTRPSTMTMVGTGAMGRMAAGIQQGARRGKQMGIRAGAAGERRRSALAERQVPGIRPAGESAVEVPEVTWGSQIPTNPLWSTPGPSEPLTRSQAFAGSSPLAGAGPTPKVGIRGRAQAAWQSPTGVAVRDIGSMLLQQR